MNKILARRFQEAEELLITSFMEDPPTGYDDIFRRLVKHIGPGGYGEPSLDPDRITFIDHGDYQGTRFFVVEERGYQPSNCWVCGVSYGSCSDCDALQSLEEQCELDDNWERIPTLDFAKGCVDLAHHMVQVMKCGTDTYSDTDSENL